MTRGLSKLCRISILSKRHFGLLLRCIVVVAAVRLTISITSYRPVLRIINNRPRVSEKVADPRLLVWGVAQAARVVPYATCLTQGLALRYFYAKHGMPCSIRIGVRQNDNGAVEAHAWVIAEGRVLLGGTSNDIARYTPVVDL